MRTANTGPDGPRAAVRALVVAEAQCRLRKSADKSPVASRRECPRHHQNLRDRRSEYALHFGHSVRKASSGEIKLARSAGIKDATRAETPSTIMATRATPGW